MNSTTVRTKKNGKLKIQAPRICYNCYKGPHDEVHISLKQFLKLDNQVICGHCSSKVPDPRVLEVADEIAGVVRKLVETCLFSVGYTNINERLNQCDQWVAFNSVFMRNRQDRDLTVDVCWFHVEDESKLKPLDQSRLYVSSRPIPGVAGLPALHEAAMRSFADKGFVVTHLDLSNPRKTLWLERRYAQEVGSPLTVRGCFGWV